MSALAHPSALPDRLPLSAQVLAHLPPLRDTQPRPGFVLDAAGVWTRRSYRGGSMQMPGVVHHRAPADSWEWIPLVWSVLTARHSFTAIELGAGWGPWMVRAYALARRIGIANRHIIGVEAEPAHFNYLRQHVTDNAIPDGDVTLWHALVAEQSGVALFPLTQTPQTSWGLRQASPEAPTVDQVLAQAQACAVPGEQGVYRLPKNPHRHMIRQTLSLADVMEGHGLVDFMHVDMQGNEVPVLPAAMAMLNDRLRLLAVGTHSPEIETTLRDCFTTHGWICHHDSAQHRDGRGMLRDGHQVWRNPRLGASPE